MSAHREQQTSRRKAATSVFPEADMRQKHIREEVAHRVAWAAVKRRYGKSGDRWIARQPA